MGGWLGVGAGLGQAGWQGGWLKGDCAPTLPIPAPASPAGADPDASAAEHAEADSFYCFVDLISEFRDHFCQQLVRAAGGRGCMARVPMRGQELGRTGAWIWRGGAGWVAGLLWIALAPYQPSRLQANPQPPMHACPAATPAPSGQQHGGHQGNHDAAQPVCAQLRRRAGLPPGDGEQGKAAQQHMGSSVSHVPPLCAPRPQMDPWMGFKVGMAS